MKSSTQRRSSLSLADGAGDRLTKVPNDGGVRASGHPAFRARLARVATASLRRSPWSLPTAHGERRMNRFHEPRNSNEGDSHVRPITKTPFRRNGSSAIRCGLLGDRGSGARLIYSQASLGLALAALLLLFVSTPRADAAVTHPLVTTFGPQGPCPCEGENAFAHPSGIAVDEASGNVFLNDGGANNVVDIFGAEGGAPAALASPFQIVGFAFNAEPSGNAVDNSATSPGEGTLYVTDVANHQLKKFTRNAVTEEYEAAGELATSSGAPFGEVLGVAVDTQGDVFVADYGSGTLGDGSQVVVKFDPAGVELDRVDVSQALGHPSAVAVDSRGDLFVSSYRGPFSGGAVYKWAANGAGEIEPGTEPSEIVAVGATGLAVDPTIDTLYVAMGGHVDQYDALTASKQGEFGSGQLGATERVAIDSQTGDVYVSDAAAGDVAVFGPAVQQPTAVTEPASVVTENGATLNGVITPAGIEVTTCEFEYGPSEAYGSTVPCAETPGEIGTGAEPVTVHGDVSTLEAAVEYHFRLVATNSNGPITGPGDRRFATATVKTERAWSVSDTTATLVGTVSSNGAPISDCHFLYGFDGVLDHAAPCSTEPGSSPAPVQVTADVSGLRPNAGYAFRLVAEIGSGGLSEGMPVSFTTLAPIVFPERHYELVSAADTNGVESIPQVASVNGERFAYATFLPTPPDAHSGKESSYVATRAADGSWGQRSLNLAPRPGEPDSDTAGELFTPGLGKVAFVSRIPADPEDQNGAIDVYLGDVDGGPLTWLSRNPSITGPQTEPGTFSTRYISADGDRAIFETEQRRLLPEAGPGGALYQWDQGALSLISRIPASGSSCDNVSGPACITTAEPLELGSGFNIPGTTHEAVSADGSRVAFETGIAPVQRLYVRLDGRRTVEASASGPGAPPLGGPPQQVNYSGADAETNSVFFTSSSPLTADSGAEEAGGGLSDLYDYDIGTGSLRDLTPTPGGGGVLRVYDVSEDGRRIYFTSSRRLDPAGRLSEEGSGLQGAAGGPNLYLAELDGEAVDLTFIATIDPQETGGQEPTGLGETFAGLGVGSPPYAEVDASSDGSYLVFRDRLPAVPGRATGGRPQVFVYDAGRSELSCASCATGGAEPAAANLTFSLPLYRGDQVGLETSPRLGRSGIINDFGPHPRNIAADGAVFFQTANALVPGDTNDRIDVYEWRGGKVELISAGFGAAPSTYGDASEDGASVFFASSDALAPGAQAGVEHIYVARVGPGSSPVTSAPPCAGADCRGAAAGPAPIPAAGTAGFAGPGNITARRCGIGKVRRHGRCVAPKKHHRRKHDKRVHRDRRQAR